MKSNRNRLVWLATGAILMLFSNGRWIIPVTAWVYPIFLLRFMRAQKPFRGFISVALVSAVVNPVIWWKMVPFPIAIYFGFACIFLQVFTLAYLADRLLATRINGFISTLVFPVTYCSIDYLLATQTPKGTWCSLAYSQADNLRLMQMVSVTGIWGITFLVTWFASAINRAWEQKFEWKRIRGGTVVFTGIAASVIVFGFVHADFFRPVGGTVRTASIVQARAINKYLSTCKWTDAEGISKYSNDVQDNLLAKTEQAAQAGAKIVLWQESAGFIPKQQEKEFTNRAMALAAHEKIYLLMSLWSVPEDFPIHRVENKLIVINPGGTQEFTYIKNKPAPPEPILKGDGRIPVLQTSFGKIATAICADGDHAGFIRQAGKNKADILFLPANDWKAIDPIHTSMAIARAIENGFSLVHPPGQGLSVATDARGHVLSSMDYYTTDEQVMYADVPTHHTPTIYARIGDVFPVLCIIALLIFIGWTVWGGQAIKNFFGHRVPQSL